MSQPDCVAQQRAGLNDSMKEKMESLQDDNKRLKIELELVSSPAARAAATREAKSSGPGAPAGGKDSAQPQKQVPASRHTRYIPL
jgi:peptidoglycan hydrolase CwlO-like protein